MITFNGISENSALRLIYNYNSLNLLTNPECSFISNELGLNAGETYSYAGKKMPKSYNEFYIQMIGKKWDVCLCVAGTNNDDSRRVVLTYMKEMKEISVNFPSAINGYSENELCIKRWLNSVLAIS